MSLSKNDKISKELEKRIRFNLISHYINSLVQINNSDDINDNDDNELTKFMDVILSNTDNDSSNIREWIESNHSCEIGTTTTNTTTTTTATTTIIIIIIITATTTTATTTTNANT
jgi:hypothetical protein